MESIACGTPVITFRTGGSPEMIDAKTGTVVPLDDMDSLLEGIERLSQQCTAMRHDCLIRARHFDKNIKYDQYVELYIQHP